MYGMVLNIKKVDDDARTIEGWASTPAIDLYGDILVPSGAIYALPIPFLLDHDHKRVVGEVDRIEVTDKGIRFWAHIAKIAGPGEIQNLCDEAWTLIKNGLRKAVSIRFAPKEFDVLPTGGRRHTSWKLLEISAVAVPAQAEAVITGFRSSPGDKIKAAIAMREGKIGRALCTGRLVEVGELVTELFRYKMLNRKLIESQQHFDRGTFTRALGTNPVRLDQMIYSERAPAIRRGIALKEIEIGRAFCAGSAPDVMRRLVADLASYKNANADALRPGWAAD